MIPTWKRCPKCRKNKKRDQFYFCSSSPHAMQSYCKGCNSSSRVENRLSRWGRDPLLYLLKQKKHDAHKDDILFTLTEEWLQQQQKFCPYLGLDFVMEPPGTGKPHYLAPTFDKIDPSRGYTPENTRIISWWANRAKGDMSDKDFRDCCLIVEERIGGRFD